MNKALIFISVVGLGLVIIPATLYLAGTMDKAAMKTLMLLGTVLWFVSTPFWMGRGKSD